MNNLSKLMVGLAAFSLAACSSDEPTPSTPDVNDGTTMYLNVRIKSADMGSRAISSTDEGKYEFGTPDEHAVSTADFFFFDKDGIYVAQGNAWNEGKPSTDNENIEYISNSIIVLKGLTKKQTPRYMVTVLNANEALKTDMQTNMTTLDDFRALTSKYSEIQREINNETKNLFVMSTTSYYDTNPSDFKYGTTLLEADNLSTEVLDDTGNVDITKLDVDPVDVYVERLAVKYTMTANNNEQTVKVTVSGFGNAEGGTQAYENIKLKISGFGVTNIADKSYITKNINGFDNNSLWSTPESWNKPAYFRSFWGKSFYYDKDEATTKAGLSGTEVAKSIDNLGSVVYSNENTKPADALKGTSDRVRADLTTNVVFTAEIKDADGNKLQLVNFNGLYFKEEQFINYVLFRMQQTGDLNFWKETTSAETGSQTDGTKTYVQVGPADVEAARPDPDVKDAHMTLAAKDANIKLYTYNKDAEAGNKFTPITDGATALNNAFKDFFTATSGQGVYPVRYNGYTVYNRPIEHLLGKNNNTDFKVTAEGQYGVVRNHWYNFEVSNILNLGDGVFDPNTDIVTPDPDPKPEKFALAARVNILSWKIVTQQIEL